MCEFSAESALKKKHDRVRSQVDEVQRHPRVLRAEQQLRMYGAAQAAAYCADEGWGSVESCLDAYSVLGDSAIISAFRRSPAQVLARLDLLAGGSGIPASSHGLSQSLALWSAYSDHDFLPGLVHYQVVSLSFFAERSVLIGRVASRVAAMSCGWDPRGVCIPEAFYSRKRNEYKNIMKKDREISESLSFQLDAWSAGASLALSVAGSF